MVVLYVTLDPVPGAGSERMVPGGGAGTVRKSCCSGVIMMGTVLSPAALSTNILMSAPLSHPCSGRTVQMCCYEQHIICLFVCMYRHSQAETDTERMPCQIVACLVIFIIGFGFLGTQGSLPEFCYRHFDFSY